MNQPEFIIVGAAKAGTTSLYRYLQQHPAVFLPEFKEPHYFAHDQAFNFDVIRDRDEYFKLFLPAGSKLAGEASTAYLYFPGVATRIKRALPNCKIIIMLREPLDIAFSMWGHQVREGLESMSFEEAIKQELNHGTRNLDGVDYGFNYIRQACLTTSVQEYLRVFGKDNVLLCDFADLRQRPQSLMRRVYQYLGVAADVSVDTSAQFNPSGKPASAWLHRFLNSRSGWRKALVAPLKLVFSEQQRHTLWAKLRDRNILSGSRHQMSADTRAQLDELLAGERAALEQLKAYLGCQCTDSKANETDYSGSKQVALTPQITN